MHRATFHNCDHTVISFIDAAQSSLLVGMCWFTHPVIFQSIQRACTRKVSVKIMLDYDHINFHPRGLDFGALEKAGAIVLGFAGPGLLHYKFAVADGCRVISGSYNWTRTEQCDHVAVLQDAELAAQFVEAFETQAIKCQPLAQLRQTTPRRLSFSLLHHPALWSVHDLRKRVVSGAKTWLVLAKTQQEWNQWVANQRHCLTAKNTKMHWPFRDVLEEHAFREWLVATALRPAAKSRLMRYGLRVRVGDVFVVISPKGHLLGAGIIGSNVELLADAPEVVSRFVQWLTVEIPTSHVCVKPPRLKSDLMRYTGSALELMAAIEANIQMADR